MECYTCRQDHPVLYHVKLRGDLLDAQTWDEGAPPGGPDGAVYQHYAKQATYRSAFVCLDCYSSLDSLLGVAEISGTTYGIAGSSRGGKATAYDEAKYSAFQKRQADRLGLPHL